MRWIDPDGRAIREAAVVKSPLGRNVVSRLEAAAVGGAFAPGTWRTEIVLHGDVVARDQVRVDP